jgi:hypothetical protein
MTDNRYPGGCCFTGLTHNGHYYSTHRSKLVEPGPASIEFVKTQDDTYWLKYTLKKYPYNSQWFNLKYVEYFSCEDTAGKILDEYNVSEKKGKRKGKK